MVDSPISDGGPLRQHRPFVLFWLTRVCATVAFQALAVAVGWQVYALTSSPFQLGLVGLVQFLPSVLFFLAVGHVADRYDRRTVLRFCQLTEGAVAATLALGTAQGWLTTEIIFALVFVFGAARAFESPTLQSLLPTIVPAEMFPRAVAGSASANQTATIIGPALGGLLYAIGPVFAYGFCAASFATAALIVTFITVERVAPPREPPTLATLFAGVTFIRRNPLVLGAISLDLFAVLLGGATALLPVFARDIFEAGPWALGLLRAAPAVGALSMSVALARWPLQRHVGRTMFISVAVFGVATILFALSRWLPLSFAMLIVLGAADVISVVIRMTLVQTNTPTAMLGRVSAVNSLFIGTSNQLGEFESGVTAAWFGTIPAVVLGGVGTIFVVLIWMRLFPQLLRADKFATVER
jgi:MFS family permease